MLNSIVIINYNDKLRIGRAIDSAINQTYQDKEIIVVDDGSDQQTREIYTRYEGKIKLIQLERDDKAKRTPSRARNAGIRESRGQKIAFLDSDNYYDVNFLTEMNKNDSDVSFCDWHIIGLENYAIDIKKVWNMQLPLLQNYLRFAHLDHQCLLIKRDYLHKCGYYDERLPRSQDCDMIVRLILGNGGWNHVNQKLFFFEKHESDQMKSVASIYGKTLWTLKNNLNIQWLLGLCKDPIFILSIYKGITDFIKKGEWQEDYKKSEFRLLLDKHNEILPSELKEKIEVLNA